MTDIQTFAAPAGKSHWVLLRQNFDGWVLIISGAYPLQRNFSRMNERGAKAAASEAVEEHLKKHGLQYELADIPRLDWHLAVRYIAA